MDVEDGIDAEKGDYQHTEAEIVDMFHRSRGLVSCAHAVFPVRDRKKNRWLPVLMFFDQDKKEFSHAFAIERQDELDNIVGKLIGASRECNRRNGGT